MPPNAHPNNPEEIDFPVCPSCGEEILHVNITQGIVGVRSSTCRLPISQNNQETEDIEVEETTTDTTYWCTECGHNIEITIRRFEDNWTATHPPAPVNRRQQHPPVTPPAQQDALPEGEGDLGVEIPPHHTRFESQRHHFSAMREESQNLLRAECRRCEHSFIISDQEQNITISCPQCGHENITN